MDRSREQAVLERLAKDATSGSRAAVLRDFDQASRFLQAGRVAEAEPLYRRVLAADPEHCESLHHLGLVAWKGGRGEEAANFIHQALAIRPSYVEAWSNLGVVLHAIGRPEEAVEACRRAIELQPSFARAHCNLGNALKARGKSTEAVAAYRRAVALEPGLAEAHTNLGDTLCRQGALDEAAASCRRAIALQPNLSEAYRALGHVLRRQGKLAEAVTTFERSAALAPDSVAAVVDLGNALREQGRLVDAIATHERALRLAPDHSAALAGLGAALRAQGSFHSAVEAYSRALTVRPDCADAHVGMGQVLADLGCWDEAIAAYRQAISLAPDFAEAYANLAGALRVKGDIAGAISAYRRAIDLNGELAEIHVEICHLRQQICDWPGLEEAQFAALDRVKEADRRVSPFAVLCLTPSPAEHQRAARRWARDFGAIAAARLPPRGPRRPGKLRIGYLSSDFNQHATASLAAELFERHDRQRFEIVGYSCGPDDRSDVRARLVRAFDRFVDFQGATHIEAAQRIREDAIDVLVDLKGYTQDSRSQILALRPAPVQASYLGYPGPLGADFIDYLIADRVVVPPDQQAFYDEKLVYLPHSYQPNDSARAIGRLPSRRECGLPEEGFVFCCMNASYKITSEVFDIWMRLLRDVPDSVLWLMRSNDLAMANLRREAGMRGIGPQRLIFAGRLPLSDHLARLGLADLFLDTLPVNAHTTASEALWAGLPVLTCIGEAFIGRVAASLLRAVGLPELVAVSLADYEAAALFLANRPALLASLRRRLADNRAKAPLFDIGRTTRDLETAFMHMTELDAAGLPPRSFAVEDLARPALSA